MDSILHISGILTEEGTGEKRSSPLIPKISKICLTFCFQCPPTFDPSQKVLFPFLSFMPTPIPSPVHKPHRNLLIYYRQCKVGSCGSVSVCFSSIVCFEFLLVFGSFITIFIEPAFSLLLIMSLPLILLCTSALLGVDCGLSPTSPEPLWEPHAFLVTRCNFPWQMLLGLHVNLTYFKPLFDFHTRWECRKTKRGLKWHINRSITILKKLIFQNKSQIMPHLNKRLELEFQKTCWLLLVFHQETRLQLFLVFITTQQTVLYQVEANSEISQTSKIEFFL